MKKKIVALLLAVALVISCAPMGMAYTTKAMQAAVHLNQLGLFAGTGNNPDGSPNFNLDAIPDRHQGITMLVGLLGKSQEAGQKQYQTPFTDVAKWAKPFVGYAYVNKLSAGTSATTFGGSQKLTAAQYVTFVLGAMGYKNNVDFVWSNPFALSDSLGITKGEYNTKSKFTRGDVAYISDNALEAKMKNSDKTLLDSLIESGAVNVPETVSKQVIYDNNGYKVTVTGMEKDDDSEVRLNLLLENNTSSDITFQVRNVSVNGYMIEPFFSCDVAAGKKANDKLTFSSWKMEEYNFSKIADFEFSLHIFSSDDDTLNIDSELIQIKTSAAETYQYTFDDKGSVVYDDNGIRIIYKNVDTSDSDDINVVLFMENTTDNYLLVQTRDTSVNGFMVDPFFSAEISPHKHMIDAIKFPGWKLSENDITAIESLEVKFYIDFNDDIENSITTDVIKIPV